MGRAFLAIYSATADRSWLQHADDAGTFIEANFVSPNSPGIATSVIHSTGLPQTSQIDENVAVARFARMLFQYTGKSEHQKLAETAMRYLASPQIAGSRRWLVGGILLADRELSTEPLHITIVGKKSDTIAQSLFDAARNVPLSYLRLEWYDSAEGSLPHMDVQFPNLPYAAAFLCTGSSCSSPAKDASTLIQKIAKAVH